MSGFHSTVSMLRPLPHNTLAMYLSPLPEPRAEQTLLETNQELRAQLAKCKQDLRDLRQNFHVSEATAYSLANHLQKKHSKDCEQIIESVLQEKLQFEKLADQSVLTEELAKFNIRIQSEKQHVLNLNQKLQEGKDVSCLLHQKLKDLLTREDLDNLPGQELRQKMAEIQSLVEQLIIKLSSDGKEDDRIIEVEKSFNISMVKKENKNLDDSREEDLLIFENISDGSSDCVKSNIKDQILTENQSEQNELDIQALILNQHIDLNLVLDLTLRHHISSEKADEDQFYASSPKAVMLNWKSHDVDENTDFIDEEFPMPSITNNASLPCWPYIFTKKAYEQEVSTLNREKHIFEVFFRTCDPIPKLERVDFQATNSTSQVHGQTLSLDGTKQKIMQRRLLNSKWTLACRFPGF